MKVQFIILPEQIAAEDKIIMGVVRLGSSSWVLWRGGYEVGDQRRERARREE